MSLTLSQLTDEMNRFVTAKGWYTAGSRAPQTPRNIASSLSIEAAEVLEHFQWSEAPRHPEDLPGELADVALYLLQIASIAGIDLEAAILGKLEKNYQRRWEDK